MRAIMQNVLQFVGHRRLRSRCTCQTLSTRYPSEIHLYDVHYQILFSAREIAVLLDSDVATLTGFCRWLEPGVLKNRLGP